MATQLVAANEDPAMREQSVFADGPDIARRVYEEQIKLLFSSRVPLATNLLNGIVMVIVLWQVLSPALTLTWGGAMLVVIAARYLLRSAFISRPQAMPTEHWAFWYVIGIGCTGLIWGATAVAVPLVGSPLYDMLVGLTAAGMSAGAIAVSAMHLRAFLAFLIPCTLPMAIAFILVGDAPHIGLGLMMLVYAGALGVMGRIFNSSLVETMQLRLQNADLAQNLSVARGAAESASRASWETSAHLSHELRTPLNAIGGFSEIMKRKLFGPLGHPKYDDYARIISDSTGHLTRLIDEILRFSKGYTGRLELDETIVETAEEIERCIQMLAEDARSGTVSVVHSIAPGLPYLRADAVKLRQVLLNILSNALKFTPPGGTISLSATTDEAGGVVIVISDTGIGIEAANLERVLEPYVQVESIFVRRHHGLGLGLPIAKRFVELHGGTLRLESTPGTGTTITIRFPEARSVPQHGTDDPRRVSVGA